MRWFLTILCLLLGQAAVAAHPGEVDTCGGHATTEWVTYGVKADGTPIVPSEPGEYHFHWTPAQVEEAVQSLVAYHTQQAAKGQARIDDLGTLTVGGQTYDILQYTRQQEAILHCQGDDTVDHTGIVRVVVP